MGYVVDEDYFGPTGNMKRRIGLDLIRPMASHRKWRYQAFWWRTYPRNHADWYRKVLRRSLRKGKTRKIRCGRR